MVKIETFKLSSFSEEFKKSQSWGSDFIQFSLVRKVNKEVKNRSTSLAMRQEKTNHYFLTSLSLDDVEFTTELLKKIVQDKEALSFNFSFELFLNLPNNDIENYRLILSEAGFIKDFTVDKIELWELKR